MEGNKGEKKANLFREKSLETIESPESLNDYLRVTSPGVWIILAAVIALLVGGIFWSIFGRINTTVNVAVVADGEKSVCYVPYDNLPAVVSHGSVTVEGQDYALSSGAEYETLIISEGTNAYARVAGKLNIGDIAVVVPIDADLSQGVHTGSVVTESLQPISLLLR